MAIINPLGIVGTLPKCPNGRTSWLNFMRVILTSCTNWDDPPRWGIPPNFPPGKNTQRPSCVFSKALSFLETKKHQNEYILCIHIYIYSIYDICVFLGGGKSQPLFIGKRNVFFFLILVGMKATNIPLYCRKYDSLPPFENPYALQGIHVRSEDINMIHESC